jgi:hypothetical protein
LLKSHGKGTGGVLEKIGGIFSGEGGPCTSIAGSQGQAYVPVLNAIIGTMALVVCGRLV